VVTGALDEGEGDISGLDAVDGASWDDEQAEAVNPRTTAATAAVARVTATPEHPHVRRCP
jgi:hypothetical protein